VKIVIAAWHVRDRNVGLGRYCRGLIEGLGEVDRENHYEVLLPTDRYRFPPFPNFRYRIIRFPLFKRRFWEQVAPLMAGRQDILHLPYDSCTAWHRGKLVTTVHDLKPLLFGTGSGGVNLNAVLEHAIVGDKWKRIDHVITDSQCSRDDLIKLLGIPPDRIAVAHPGVDHNVFRPAEASSKFDVRSLKHDEPRTSNLEPGTGSERPYLLCVAGADPTKNVGGLIEAFGRLPDELRHRHDLVIVGDLRRRPEVSARVRQLGLEKQVRFPGIVEDAELVSWYQDARIFVFPSLYEGFGLPVLEAMACGCPVISSNRSSLPEVAGDAALLVDPGHVEALTGAIVRVLNDTSLQEDLRGKGLAQAARFTWARTAKAVVEVYRKIAEG
jgi:glycosyltransferase involved in cell wall biosynthesis